MGQAVKYFIMGFGQLIDFNGTYTRVNLKNKLNLHQTEQEALANDWKAVGNYIRRAMNVEELHQHSSK